MPTTHGIVTLAEVLHYGESDASKATLAAFLLIKMDEHGLAPMKAAKVAGLSQAMLDDLKRGRLHDISVDRLLRAIVRLGYDIEIHVRLKP